MAIHEYRKIGKRITPFAEAVLSESNLLVIHNGIQSRISKKTREKVIVTLGKEFITWMLEFTDGLATTPRTEDNIYTFNLYVVNREVNIQYLSLRHKALFEKYFIRGDRERISMYPQYRHERNSNKYDLGSCPYMLSSPWRVHHLSYLRDVDMKNHVT
jgi:hypothetical protein